MYEDRTTNYDPEIHEKYPIHDTPFPLPHQLPRLKRQQFSALTVSLKSGF